VESVLWFIVFAVVIFAVWKVWQSSSPNARSGPPRHVEGDGEFQTEVVGESHYQGALESICGGRCEEGHNKEVLATLVLEDSNRHDRNAVRVDIEGTTVGYLSRPDARDYRRKLTKDGQPRATITCKALIRGGWDRGNGDQGHFGVCLDLPDGYP
jgi:hypothetical protein